MKALTRIGIGILSGLMAVAFLINPDVARAQNYNSRNCAWPIELSPEGSGNVQGPDGAARYWAMPFDTTQYETMTIKGTYPNIRYFSFAAYETETITGGSTNSFNSFNLAGHLYDAQIAPDSGTVNPFVPPPDGSKVKVSNGSANGTYTVVISRNGQTSGNTIAVSPNLLVWVALRMYAADADPSESGQSLMGGVPLPTITLNGASQPLAVCSPVNKWLDASAFAQFLFPPALNLSVNEGTPPSNRLWFASPLNPPSVLWPNPDSKYMMMWPGNDYQPGRIIVIHGKAPGFPGTFRGSPIWVPSRGFRTVDMRYWALCEQDFEPPLSLLGCATDLTTNLVGGYYTIVISDDMVRPEWLLSRPNVNWLPYGDEQYPKFVVLRNMLPAADFPYAVRDVWATTVCTFNLEFPDVPDRSAIDDKGPCAQEVMGDYYPVAVWCDKSKFIAGGFRACLKE